MPAAERARVCTRLSIPSKRCHRNTALPPASTATRGSNAFFPGSERVWVELSVPAAERARVWIRCTVPSEPIQAKTALPFGSTATCADDAFWPAAERVRIGPRVPAAVRVRAWIRSLLVPS